jgi:hypothetical protein
MTDPFSSMIGREVVGLALGVLNGDQTITRQYGQMDGDEVVPIGSITKLFTAVLLADMVQRQEVHLEDPISRHLASSLEWSRPAAPDITLERSQRPRRAMSPQGHIAMAWHIRQLGDRTVLWHNGGTSGFGSFCAFERRRSVAVVALYNSAPTPKVDAACFSILGHPVADTERFRDAASAPRTPRENGRRHSRAFSVSCRSSARNASVRPCVATSWRRAEARPGGAPAGSRQRPPATQRSGTARCARLRRRGVRPIQIAHTLGPSRALPPRHPVFRVGANSRSSTLPS